MVILELKGVSKSFSRNGRTKSQTGKIEVLRDINLSIRENEFVCIVGFLLDRLMGLAEAKLRTV